MESLMRRVAPLAAASLLACAFPSWTAAEDGAFRAAEPSILNLNAFAFQPFDGAAVAGSDASGGRFIRSGNTCLEAPVILPTGAVIDHMQLELCDHERDVDLVAALFSCSAGTCTITMSLNSSIVAGCGRVRSVNGTAVVQNATATYFLQVCTNVEGDTNSLRAARVFYSLDAARVTASAGGFASVW